MTTLETQEAAIRSAVETQEAAVRKAVHALVHEATAVPEVHGVPAFPYEDDRGFQIPLELLRDWLAEVEGTPDEDTAMQGIGPGS